MEAFEGLTGFRRVVDDVIIYDKDSESHVGHVKQFLQRCQERWISINKDKWAFCRTRVRFAGFQVSSQGYRIDSSITEALASFPTPANRTDLRSFFGLANQLSSCTDIVVQLLLPLCPLLSTKHEFFVAGRTRSSICCNKTALSRHTNSSLLQLDKANKAVHRCKQTGDRICPSIPIRHWSLDPNAGRISLPDTGRVKICMQS